MREDMRDWGGRSSKHTAATELEGYAAGAAAAVCGDEGGVGWRPRDWSSRTIRSSVMYREFSTQADGSTKNKTPVDNGQYFRHCNGGGIASTGAER